MLPKFIDAPNMPTLNIIIYYVYTEYTFIIAWHLVYERQRWQLKRKTVSRDSTNTELPTAT